MKPFLSVLTQQYSEGWRTDEKGPNCGDCEDHGDGKSQHHLAHPLPPHEHHEGDV